MRHVLRLAFLCLLPACESGTARTLQLTVPAEIAGRFSASAPGLLVSDLSGAVAPWAVLCGQALETPLSLSHDEGFGCLGERVGTAQSVRAWVEPIDAGAFTCSAKRSFYTVLASSPADGGSPAWASAPEAGWAQASGIGNWRRDLSPCGGVLSVAATLAVP